MTALPPENLLMTIAPGIFGDIDLLKSKVFVGSSFPWEHFMYLGVAAVTLALYGIFQRGARARTPVGSGSFKHIEALVLGFGRVYIRPFSNCSLITFRFTVRSARHGPLQHAFLRSS